MWQVQSTLEEKRRESSFEDEDEEREDMDMNVEKATIVKRKTPKLKEN